MSALRRNVIGVSAGLAAAGVATAAGFAAERLLRSRSTSLAHSEELLAASAEPDFGEFTELPDREVAVIADDGVPLHAEVDDPRGPAPAAGGAAVPTLVLSHGFAQSLEHWVFQRRALRDAGYRVVLWDQRGHGRSGPGDDASYVVEQLGDDLAAVIRQVVPDGPVVLIGHSMGGMATMAFAARYPDLFRDRVIGVGLVSTSGGELSGLDFGMSKQIAGIVHRVGPAAVSRLASRKQLVESSRSVGKDVETFLVHRFAFGTKVPASVVRLTADMIFRTDLHVISAFMTGLLRHDHRAATEQLAGVETLVMHGGRDRVIPVEHGDALVAAMPGSEHVLAPDAGHNLPLEMPELVTSELVGLVERSRRAVAAPPAPATPAAAPRIKRTVRALGRTRRTTSSGSR